MSEKQKPVSATTAVVDYYKYDHSKMKVRIDQEHYSNVAYVAISGRDAYIDFLKMPGIIDDGIPVVSGIRIYLPITAALRLSDALGNTVNTMEERGAIEPLHPLEPKPGAVVGKEL